MENLTPQQIVTELNRYIIGQDEAKKSVAVALRNRYRRSLLPEEAQEEISPKNIIMIGPTGVGKTEIARRLAKLVKAPFVKVEATKFTEVGYVGRDVESIVRDLVEAAVRQVNDEKVKSVERQAEKMANDRLLDLIAPLPKKKSSMTNPFEMFFNSGKEEENDRAAVSENPEEIKNKREILKEKLKRQELEDDYVEVEVEDTNAVNEMLSSMGMDEMAGNVSDMFSGLVPKKTKKRKVTVEQARKILTQQEAEKLIDFEEVKQEAIKLAENAGIIFLDEIDKIATKGGGGSGPDVSREGVQRDILPIVEGCTVKTKYGNVNTDHMLFIAAGAFHVSKPDDLIPELQGRFPVRVELESLSEKDLERILREPSNSLLKQYEQLLSVEGVTLTFTEDAVSAIATMAADMNEQTEDIGARRLHTVLEKLLEDVMFSAVDGAGEAITIDKDYVEEKLSGLVKDKDFSKFIL